MALNMKPGCCCTGFTCGPCSGIPDTLTYTATFSGGCSVSATLIRSGSAWNGIITPPCGCAGLTQSPDQHVVLACTVGGTGLSLSWPDFAPGSCGWQIIGTGTTGTFTCSPFLWTWDGSTDGGCHPVVCAFALPLSHQTISA